LRSKPQTSLDVDVGIVVTPLIDQRKQIHVEGEVDVVDTSVWFANIARGECSIGMNLTAAIDRMRRSPTSSRIS
jgi:hypothetical protein